MRMQHKKTGTSPKKHRLLRREVQETVSHKMTCPAVAVRPIITGQAPTHVFMLSGYMAIGSRNTMENACTASASCVLLGLALFPMGCKKTARHTPIRCRDNACLAASTSQTNYTLRNLKFIITSSCLGLLLRLFL